ncbi:hypothetical protein Pcinc_028570 [Petrolisthes cinctipes]|uniref:Uncharacterized protein n=1 Tax=Petrolisthes cinctipes TaxID=88211 RepID=A0AAE1K8P5_PETCI|nr:hypothetical protein Pcinc_028570 [Petrolisthes cinctipes]
MMVMESRGGVGYGGRDGAAKVILYRTMSENRGGNGRYNDRDEQPLLVLSALPSFPQHSTPPSETFPFTPDSSSQL